MASDNVLLECKKTIKFSSYWSKIGFYPVFYIMAWLLSVDISKG